MNYPEGFKPEAIFGRRRYVKEGRVRVAPDQARQASCRGKARAQERRGDREKRSRWREANLKSLPFRTAKIERAVERAKKMEEVIVGGCRSGKSLPHGKVAEAAAKEFANAPQA